MITDAEIEESLHYLLETAELAAHARADRAYIEEYRKSLKAQIMSENAGLPVNAQERNAYADPRYLAHLDALKTAVFEDERLRFLMEAARIKIDAWRTVQASERAARL